MKNTVFILFFLLGLTVSGQVNKLIATVQLPIKNARLAADNLGNSYIFDFNTIIKYNPEGDSIGTYSNNRLGNISSIDVTNPYKILVFYSDYSVIVFLDNFLTAMETPIALDRLGYDGVTLACSSQENGLWLFDRLQQKLIKLGKDLTVTNKSINLSQWIGNQINPKTLIEQNSTVALHLSNESVIIFDQFATFDKVLSIKTTNEIQVINQNIIFQTNDTLFQYSPKQLVASPMILPLEKTKSAKISKDRLLLLKNEKLYIYHYLPNKR
jgi:hypothetical protein